MGMGVIPSSGAYDPSMIMISTERLVRAVERQQLTICLRIPSFQPPLAGGLGVHGRDQHDGEEAEARRVAAAATTRVGDHRERLDAMHRRVPPYRCCEATRMIPKDENPEKPYTLP